MASDPEKTTLAHLTSVLDCLPHPAILIGRDLAIEAANERFRTVFAGGRELRGLHCHEVSHGSSRPCDLAGEECPLLLSGRTGRPRHALHVHRTPRGLEHVSITVRPVCDDAGKAVSFVETLQPSTIASAEPCSDRLVGRSPAFNRMLDRVEQFAAGDTSVLLIGEPGSGREAVARAIHCSSWRRHRPFVPIDCSGARQPGFESELFGSLGDDASGTGAKPGLMEATAAGTVYLNEIGDIPPAAQAELLRALETWTVRRRGEWRAREADFRLLCSTSADPQRLVDEGRLMPELLHRAAGVSIHVPALRERPDDLELLVATELSRLQACCGCRLGDGTLEVLRAYAFPGNLRELETVLQHACVLASDGVILPEHLPARLDRGRSLRPRAS